MIRLNVFILLDDEKNKKALKKAAIELVELSKQDKGCVDYDFFESATISKHSMICETWANEDDLKAHMNSDHFKRLVPEIENYGKMKLEKFEF